jgi:hypothetical protein
MEKIKNFVKKNANVIVVSVLTTLAVGHLRDNVSVQLDKN